MDDFDKLKLTLLKKLQRCLVCHREYEESDIHAVERRRGYWTMMVECEQCHARNYVAAVSEDGGAEEAVLDIRRLTREAIEEAKRRVAKLEDAQATHAQEPAPDPSEPVSAADVLEMHEFLEDFDGDFASLFRASDT